MTQIYLDVDDVVRVDLTPDRKEAREAKSHRIELNFLTACQRLARTTMRINALRGRDTAPSQKHLACVLNMKADTIVRVRKRIDSLQRA